MLRLILCAEDKPETGGYIDKSVLPKSPTINGFHQAFIGSKSFCDACKSFGLIEKSGGPSRRTHSGLEIALDGDILRCQCSQPPKMKAMTQSISRHNDGIEHLGSFDAEKSATIADSSGADSEFDEQVRIVNASECDEYPYRIKSPDIQPVSGRLSATGLLPRVSTEFPDNTYFVVWGDEALAEQ
ncbi:PAAR domain-containing protein [Burkholderia sp. Ax-1719]|uniref:PAAR domain-containing protein n=1 Tax=Burkholderia sp. Ax-1719 TaxID=2608334 RepID=UPI00142108CD|nr:PAAR domain-containing protein [Burkholderia sp. Ax-1719]